MQGGCGNLRGPEKTFNFGHLLVVSVLNWPHICINMPVSRGRDYGVTAVTYRYCGNLCLTSLGADREDTEAACRYPMKHTLLNRSVTGVAERFKALDL